MSITAYYIFIAPKGKQVELPIEKSIWHDERSVRIPTDQWEILLDYAATIDSGGSVLLDEYSKAMQDHPDDLAKFDLSHYRTIYSLLSRMINELINKKEQIYEQYKDRFDMYYYNTEYIKILKALRAVFQESILLKKGFSVWID